MNDLQNYSDLLKQTSAVQPMMLGANSTEEYPALPWGEYLGLSNAVGIDDALFNVFAVSQGMLCGNAYNMQSPVCTPRGFEAWLATDDFDEIEVDDLISSLKKKALPTFNIPNAGNFLVGWYVGITRGIASSMLQMVGLPPQAYPMRQIFGNDEIKVFYDRLGCKQYDLWQLIGQTRNLDRYVYSHIAAYYDKIENGLNQEPKSQMRSNIFKYVAYALLGRD